MSVNNELQSVEETEKDSLYLIRSFLNEKNEYDLIDFVNQNKTLLSNKLVEHTANMKMLYKNYIQKRDEVREAKLRVDLDPELKTAIELFQQKENEKLVGANEQLLTAILKDVMTTDDEERKVILDIFTERGLPALKIYVDKNEQGMKEDAYNGAGGAIANILSLGLRAIALVQSKERRFLVLDEPDCWIKPEIIPDFVSVIKQLSEKLGIQILMISHHNENLLQAIPHRLLLEKVNGRIITNWSTGIGCEMPVWNEDDVGIRSIYLENFQSHSSTLIPLSKNVTLLTGNNDLGKSTIVNALRSVFYGLADDTNIKHFEEEAVVSIDFGDKTLYWKRKLKGKPKESYILLDENHDFSNPLHQSDTARELPDWVQKETGIGYIDGFDIQLGHQKKPVFLLDESPSTKAKALSIGDESHYFNELIALAKQDLSEARQVIKLGEKEMEKTYKTLRIYEKYTDLFSNKEENTNLIQELDAAFDNLSNEALKIQKIKSVVGKLFNLKEKQKLTEELLNNLDQNNYEGTKEIQKSILEYSQNYSLINEWLHKQKSFNKYNKLLKQFEKTENQENLNFELSKNIGESLKLIERLSKNKQSQTKLISFLESLDKIKEFNFNEEELNLIKKLELNKLFILSHKMKQNLILNNFLNEFNSIKNESIENIKNTDLSKDKLNLIKIIDLYKKEKNSSLLIQENLKEKTKTEMLINSFEHCPLCKSNLKHNNH